MFAASTKEIENGVVEIKDMDYKTVKNAINFCLGHDMKDKSIQVLLGVHQFANKYGIVTAVNCIEKFILLKMTDNNLAMVIDYAWKHSHSKTCMNNAANSSMRILVFFCSIRPS